MRPTVGRRETPGGKPWGNRSSLFCDAALASRIEAAETELIVAASRAAQARSGTAGVRPPDLADPEIGTVLSDRRYRLEGFENVLGIAFDSDPHLAAPPGIEVRLGGAYEFEAWLAVVAEGSIRPDTEGLPWHDEFPREAVEDAERDFAIARVIRYAALHDGLTSTAARVSRVALLPYLVFYSAFDAVGDLSNGLVVMHGSERPPAEQAVLTGVSDALANLVHQPAPLTLDLIRTLSWAGTVIAAQLR